MEKTSTILAIMMITMFEEQLTCSPQAPSHTLRFSMATHLNSFCRAMAQHIVSECQLVLPEQMCEMECLKEAGAPSSLTYEDPRAQKCREYCLVHAYDWLKEQLSTTPSE